MSAYDVTIRVPNERMLTEVITVMKPPCAIRSISLVPDQSQKRSMAYANGKRNKGILGKDLLVDLFKKKATRTTKEIADAFVKAGFSSNSASPRIAALKQEGGIKQVGANTYQRV